MWKEAIAEEYVSLTAETQAIKPLSAAEVEELMKHAEVEVATGKGVFTRKAGSGKETKEEVFAGGADSIASDYSPQGGLRAVEGRNGGREDCVPAGAKSEAEAAGGYPAQDLWAGWGH